MASFVTKPVSTNIQSINPFTCNQSQNQTRQILQAIPMHVVSRINQPFVVPSQTNRNSFIYLDDSTREANGDICLSHITPSIDQHHRRLSRSYEHDITNKRAKCHSLVEGTTITIPNVTGTTITIPNVTGTATATTDCNNLHRQKKICISKIISNQQLINHIDMILEILKFNEI
ncbi:unnamed protein product [Rotaria magnacalcarata]|uniref:Uncharacterized protein n=2 Tax=Rotaria magnacalcarata TaxID=392030 RepID=A0A8S2PHK9_9BILA|nr:unnamed protein product [Rotaria magnacalcarata]CAF4100903.1 unnamed protein product [Rotaria magnacalcarata]